MTDVPDRRAMSNQHHHASPDTAGTSSDTKSGSASAAAPAFPTPRILYPSWVDRFRRCEKAFYLAHVLKENQAREPSAQLTLGDAVHDALKLVYRLPAEQRQPEHLEVALRSVWPKHRTPETFFSREEERACGLAALGMLRSYAERYELGRETLATEQSVRHRLRNGALVAGFIDRIDQHSSGEGLELIDYKTGRSILDEEDMRWEPAVQIYTLGAASTYKRPVARVRFIYLALEREVVWEPEDDDLESIDEHLVRLTDDLYSRDEFPASPGDHCRFCDFQLRCPERQQIDLDELIPVEGLPF